MLFDVDGTLLMSGGAGLRAMTAAFADVFGVEHAFEGIPVAGYTDSFLVSRALTRAGQPDTPEAHARFRQRYLELLPAEIVKPGSGRRGLMPGVTDLLAVLTRRDEFYTALLTGNYEPAAKVKLSHFGIATFFSWGAFGEDSHDRGELARLALARAAGRGVPPAARENAVVIGDTPHDIRCARIVGARVVAVATGDYAVDELQASGADAVVADLSDTSEVIARITCG